MTEKIWNFLDKNLYEVDIQWCIMNYDHFEITKINKDKIISVVRDMEGDKETKLQVQMAFPWPFSIIAGES